MILTMLAGLVCVRPVTQAVEVDAACSLPVEVLDLPMHDDEGITVGPVPVASTIEIYTAGGCAPMVMPGPRTSTGPATSTSTGAPAETSSGANLATSTERRVQTS